MMRFAILPLVLLTGACMDEGRPGRPGRPPRPPMPGVECNSNGLQRFVGQQRNPRLAERAKRMSGARTVRWLEPDMATTMEFRADRLNLVVDRRNRITSARCG